MTPLEPGYGETTLDWDELAALLPDARDVPPDPPTKADVYDLEQAVQTAVTEDLVGAVLDGAVGLEDIVTDRFLRAMHARLYGDIRAWGGRLRRHELSIGVAPEQIAMELRGSLDGITYRWRRTSDWTAHQLGIAVHAETVRIHPFIDGNGRSTRLLADLPSSRHKVPTIRLQPTTGTSTSGHTSRPCAATTGTVTRPSRPRS